MTWTPQLVALDIDGTIVDDEGYLDPQTRAAIDRVVAAGVPVVMATGRGWGSTRPIMDALELPPALAVCSNGAVLASYPPASIEEVVTFDPRSIIERVSGAHPDWLLAVEVIGEGFRVNQPFPEGELSGRIWVESIEQLASERVTRVIMRDANSNHEEFARLAAGLDLHGVSYFIGYSAWLDIAPSGVDKGYGLGRVCDRLSIDPADVLAVGDGYNDLEMLVFAGRGVAMGQAPDAVIAHADAVTGTVAELGLAAELGRWF